MDKENIEKPAVIQYTQYKTGKKVYAKWITKSYI